jgi:hypothetical protein
LNRDGTTGLGFEESLAGNPCTTGEAKSATAARIVVDPEIMMKGSLYEPGVLVFQTTIQVVLSSCEIFDCCSRAVANSKFSNSSVHAIVSVSIP